MSKPAAVERHRCGRTVRSHSWRTAMDYMLMFYETKADFDRRSARDDSQPYWAGWMSYVQAMHASGLVKCGAGLQPPATATTLRTSAGKRHVQDGPFADTKEQLAGFFVIDVPDLDTALAWASRGACAGAGGFEGRRVLPPPPAA